MNAVERVHVKQSRYTTHVLLFDYLLRKKPPEKRKAWRGRRMRQALNLIDNWEEEDVVDPYRTTLGGGVRRSMSNIYANTGLLAKPVRRIAAMH